MELDLGPLLRGEVTRMTFDFSVEAPDIPAVSFPKPVSVSGEVTDQGGYKRLRLNAELPYRAQCARCLADVEGVYSLDFERTVALRQNLTEEQLEDAELEYVIPENGKIDVDGEIRDEIVMCFPSRFLCTPDCPGLCPKCGRPIRSGSCNCASQDRIDPRMAVLAQLLEDDSGNGETKQ